MGRSPNSKRNVSLEEMGMWVGAAIVFGMLCKFFVWLFG